MAMLAGPRRKQKVVNLRAKNSAWSKDSGKFGQRMLERMGWSSGKGLGAREDGMVEHVIARYKNDECGLGYEDKNDQWTEHEDQFNALLAGLSNGGSDAETTHSGVSLEAKSKQSKARVHYHKFTRGKDLSRYSEKDLANIFGKKSLKDKRKREEKEEQTQSEERSAIFTDGGNMQDYFTGKMKALGRTVEPVSRDYDDCEFRGFAGTQAEDNIERDTLIDNEEDNCDKKKKKKSKRERADMKQEVEEIEKQENNAEATVELENGLKKKKCKADNDQDLNSEAIMLLENASKKKKKKKCKSDRPLTDAEAIVQLENGLKEKKCKADNTLELEASENALPSVSEQTDDVITKKKKSKRRKCEEEATEDVQWKKKTKSL